MKFKNLFLMLCEEHKKKSFNACMVIVDDIPTSDDEAASYVDFENVLFDYQFFPNMVKGFDQNGKLLSFNVIDKWFIDGIQWFKIDN